VESEYHTLGYTFVFDLETTGLPPRGVSPSFHEKWENCRIVEIAWELYDREYNLVEQRSYLIKPIGFSIPESATKIHGISTNEAMHNGVDLSYVIQHFEMLLPHISCIVAHNISFDINVLLSEIYRMGLYDVAYMIQRIPQHCTMLYKLKPKEKWPKLIEKYRAIFGKEPSGDLHRAGVDVRLCAQIFLHQIERC